MSLEHFYFFYVYNIREIKINIYLETIDKQNVISSKNLKLVNKVLDDIIQSQMEVVKKRKTKKRKI